MPYYGATEYSPKSIASWISRYTREGFEGLKPRRRSDKGESGKIPRDVRERIIQLR
ncbi:MAG TPA: helix-turn-helix domain-containing protein [Firmicutes bacterium]|nr:helix-turn-helix domain-containing protein [Candidatus Fermentithermobacillaceae bacterium]